MKKLVFSVAAVIIVTAAILLVILMLGGEKEAPENSSDFVSAESVEAHASDTPSATESVESTDGFVLGALLKECADIVESGTYKLTVTRQMQIGGLSVPATTVTCYGNGVISIVEYEGHDIMSETFVNEDGAYHINADLNSAFLLPADTVTADTLEYKDLKYIESGSTNAGTSAYDYERYITPTGQTVDYLFSNGTLEKMKLYIGEEYELITIKLSTDISEMRKELPEGLWVVDNR